MENKLTVIYFVFVFSFIFSLLFLFWYSTHYVTESNEKLQCEDYYNGFDFNNHFNNKDKVSNSDVLQLKLLNDYCLEEIYNEKN